MTEQDPDSDTEPLPEELLRKIRDYGEGPVQEHPELLGSSLVDRIKWDVSSQLYRVGGYCESHLAEPPRHRIVVSYPAFLAWGWDRVQAIIRHEVAHAVVHEEHGTDVESHGKEFRDIADRLNAPVQGEEPLPYRYRISCAGCGRFVNGLYCRSIRTENPERYCTDCCSAPLEVERETVPYE